MKALHSLAFTFLAVLLLAPPSRAVDVVVTTLRDELNTPSSGGNGISLREAIRDVGNSGGTITFDPSLDGGVMSVNYAPPPNTVRRRLSEDTGLNVVIDALALPSGLTIDGATDVGFFTWNSSTVTLRGLTFRNGTNIALAAPITVSTGTLTVEHCTFVDNTGGDTTGAGGCIIANSSQLRIVGCTFVRNTVGNTPTASGGGAVAVTGNGTVTILNSTFTGNDAGICKTQGQANYGGAILLTGFDGTCTLSHCTISQNRALEGGGGLAVVDSPNATLIVENSIIALNQAGVIAGAFTAQLAGAGDDVLLATSAEATLAPKLTIRGACIIPGIRSDRTDGATDGDGRVLKVQPKLRPIGAYGGRTPTMALQSGSPAIDAAPDPLSGLSQDQCGNLRKRGRFCDIGAFEYDPFSFDGVGVTVTTTADKLEPPGNPNGVSLREALRGASTGSIIRFDPALTQVASPVIALDPALGPLVCRPGRFTVDAGATGATLDGTGQTQVLQVDPGVTLNLRRFTLKGGNGQQSNVGNFVGGGGIVNGGNLTLVECSVEGNTSLTRGGGIENNGTLLAQRCSFLGNTANTGEPDAETGGGAVANLGKATFENCTFSGNTAAFGGAIDQSFISGAAFPVLLVSHCTISGNTSNAVGIPPDDPPGPLADSGGGIYSFFDWTLQDSIVAGNTPNDVTNADDGGFQRGGLRGAGNNIVPVFLNVRDGKRFGFGFLTSDPMLGSLDFHGGPTQTISLLDGSPAIDAAVTKLSTATGPTDQRGYGITGKPDIGAYEAGAFSPGSFKVQLTDDMLPALPERAAPAGAPIVITSGDSELTLEVKSDGSFKGTLVFLNGKYTFSGQLGEDRTASIPLTGRNLPALTLDITISGANDENIAVTVTGSSFSGSGSGTELVPARRYTAPPEIVGRYTAVMIGNPSSTDQPVLGVLAFEITKSGLVRLIGSLNDGTKFALGTRIAQAPSNAPSVIGRIPLYRKKGFISFEITPNGADNAHVARISRPPGAKPATPASLAGGFEHFGVNMRVRRYVPPAKGAPIVPGVSDNPMGMHADLKTGDDAGAPRLTAYDFTLPAIGRPTSAVTGFKLKVVPKFGLILGAHPNPTPGVRPPVLPFFGVLMQNFATSAGYGLSKDADVPYWLDFQPGPAGP